ncbi:hypothetical protein D3C87_1738810 [compost metagenome]
MQDGRQTTEIGDLAETRMAVGFVVMLECPGEGMRHVDAPAAGVERRHDVGFQRVADHQAFRGAVAVAFEDPVIGGDGLVADDLDGVEIVSQSRGGKLALLVEEVALGDHHQPEGAMKRLERFLDMRQRLDRVNQHLAPRSKDFGNHR